jgi:hypothetical protein
LQGVIYIYQPFYNRPWKRGRTRESGLCCKLITTMRVKIK